MQSTRLLYTIYVLLIIWFDESFRWLKNAKLLAYVCIFFSPLLRSSVRFNSIPSVHFLYEWFSFFNQFSYFQHSHDHNSNTPCSIGIMFIGYPFIYVAQINALIAFTHTQRARDSLVESQMPDSIVNLTRSGFLLESLPLSNGVM